MGDTQVEIPILGLSAPHPSQLVKQYTDEDNAELEGMDLKNHRFEKNWKLKNIKKSPHFIKEHGGTDFKATEIREVTDINLPASWFFYH